MADNLDLNIYNYTYSEILTLLKLDNNFDKKNIEKLNTFLIDIKSRVSSSYYTFFLQAYKIVIFVYSLYHDDIILNNDSSQIELYVNKIKKIPSFERLSVSEILERLNINKSNQSNQSNQSNPNTDVFVPTVQEQKNTNNVNSVIANNVGPGYLNSIKRVTHLLNLNLNTFFRKNYYHSNPCNFQYIIPMEIKHVVALRLASIEIPNSWYLFSSVKGNNVLKIIITNNSVVTEYDLLIPNGNYDSLTLPDYLNNNLLYNSGTSTDLQYIEYSIDPYSSKSKFSLIGLYPANLTFTLVFSEDVTNNNSNIINTIGWSIGYRLGIYKNITNYVNSEGLFDAGGDRYIYVSIDDYQYNNNPLNIVCFDNSIMDKNIIAKIPMVNGKLSLTVDDNTSYLTKTRKYNGPVNLRNLFIKIIDQFGHIIDLNNMDYSFSLELEVLYEGFNFKDINS